MGWMAIGSMLIWNPSSIFTPTTSIGRDDELYSRNNENDSLNVSHMAKDSETLDRTNFH